MSLIVQLYSLKWAEAYETMLSQLFHNFELGSKIVVYTERN